LTVFVDAKGKVFTDVVHKDEVPVLIQTVTGQIHGHVYIHPDHRLIDEMNGEAGFIAVTNAQVFGPDGQALYHSAFLTVNKQQVVWVRPDDEVLPAEAEQ
jgi:hypothetical protein